MRQLRADDPELFAQFQFTHPVWGATSDIREERTSSDVSIHAPRVGCDSFGYKEENKVKAFQFTHPVWGATYYWR